MKNKRLYPMLCVLLLALLLTGVTAAAEDKGPSVVIHSDTISIEGLMKIPEEGTPRALHRVTFFDVYGTVCGWADVPDGEHIAAPRFGKANGHVLVHWYDEAGPGIDTPYPFGNPVRRDLNLWPVVRRATDEELLADDDLMFGTDGIAITLPDDATFFPETEQELLLDSRAVINGAEDEETVAILGESNPETEEQDMPEGEPENIENEEGGEDEAVRVEVKVVADDEGIGPGSLVTLTSELYGVPAGASVAYQWQSDASGAFEDVPGADGSTYSYVVDEEYPNSNWRVQITVEIP